MIIVIVSLAFLGVSAPDDHEVTSLKGYYDFSNQFKMYSGYLTIQQSPKIATYYVFITSKDKPETDDVVVWLNGGPGCSSLLGMIYDKQDF